jgi:thiol-disulfide isomerase/thioredoxin
MIKQRILFILTLLFWYNLKFNAQNIQCSFPSLKGTKVKFGTFEGLNSKILDSAIVDATGNFSFQFSIEKPAIAYLVNEENKPYFLILDKGEQISLKGQYFSIPETIKVLAGKQNQAFSQYATEHPKREQTLSAWRYLDRIYTLDSLFIKDKKSKKFISKQYAKIKKEDQDFLNRLDTKSYVAWYLPTRRLVSDVSIIAQYRTEEIPATIRAFRLLDYTDERLYRSGLFKDAIESHFWLLENCGKSLDSVFIEMKVSIDSMMTKLVKNEKKLNEVTDYLFDLLERHSLFQASEYLALKVLNEVSCTINNDLAKQLETYRAMKKGNIAPDFIFYPTTIFPSDISREKTQKLSDLKTPYTLVVFGSSSCPKCTEEIPQIAELYTKWKEQGVEVIFVSLDETGNDFQNFTSSFPFVSTCDFKKWKSPIVESYYVFGTPTMFLLDNKQEILLRPNSVKQMDAWVDWFLIQGNR